MFRSGYVAILGVPNVGKSTLLNSLLGEKLAIVTPKPQTTRHRILGILNRPHAQILFLDTPGIHVSNRPLNEALVQTALQSLGDADVVLHLVFPKKNLSDEDLEIARRIHETRKPYLVLINRIDEVAKDSLLPLIQNIQQKLSPKEIIPVSALTGDGLETIPPLVEKYLPEGPAYYPTDIYTEHDLRFLSAEIVREKAMLFLQQELPYQLASRTSIRTPFFFFVSGISTRCFSRTRWWPPGFSTSRSPRGIKTPTPRFRSAACPIIPPPLTSGS